VADRRLTVQRELSLTLLCGAILLTGLSLYSPATLSLAPHEASLLERAGQPLVIQLSHIYSPFYLLLLGQWQDIGQHPLWLRLPGVLTGLLALFMAARVMRVLTGTHAAPSGLLLLAGAPFLIAQTRAISPATLALVAALASMILFAEYMRAGGRHWLGGWVAATILSWGIQGGLIFLPLLQSAVVLLYRERYTSDKQRWWWLAQALVLVLFALAFWQPFAHFLGARLPALTPLQTAEAIPLFALLSTNLPLPEALPGMLLVLLLALSGLRAADWRKDPRHGLLILGLLAPCPFYLFTPQSEALLLCALPGLFGLAAMGLRLYPRWARQGLWTAVALCNIWSYWHLY
jgi:hypothetical protein